MKNLKMLEMLYSSQIKQFENPELFESTERTEGIIIGLKMALVGIREEMKKLRVK